MLGFELLVDVGALGNYQMDQPGTVEKPFTSPSRSEGEISIMKFTPPHNRFENDAQSPDVVPQSPYSRINGAKRVRLTYRIDTRR